VSGPERISKVLAAAGIASRRGADSLVSAGRVRIDGRVAELGERADPSSQRIEVDGRPLALSESRPVYLALHKPAGVTSTVRDRHAERTVIDLVPPDLRRGARLFPVGRLDRESEGLILLTDDGDWAETILHPRYGVEREYAVAIDRPLDAPQVEELLHGIALEEGMATLAALREQTRTETRRIADVVVPPPDDRLVWYRATIRQGWKRQLRRMFGLAGRPVRRLVRVRIGALRMEDLASGDVRPLAAAEVRRLRPGGPSSPAPGQGGPPPPPRLPEPRTETRAPRGEMTSANPSHRNRPRRRISPPRPRDT
jgi:23S rRNA pseudouridine2605 synthase